MERTRKIERLTFALPPAERQALETLAREGDYSVSQLVRRGVRHVLAESVEQIAITMSDRDSA